MTTTQTPRELYEERHGDVIQLMAWIGFELERDRINAKANPEDWNYPSDMGEVRRKLIHVLAFLTDDDPAAIDRQLIDER